MVVYLTGRVVARKGAGSGAVRRVEAEHVCLVRFQVAPSSQGKIRVGEASNPDAEEFLNLMAQSPEHFTDLAFETSFEDDGNTAGRKSFDGFGAGVSLRGLYPGDEFLQDWISDCTGKGHAVFLFDLVAGVSQTVGQVTIIGEDQEPFRIPVQAAHMVEMLKLGRE